jgi:hypothetical protein
LSGNIRMWVSVSITEVYSQGTMEKENGVPILHVEG